jgi:hypothetical protein
MVLIITAYPSEVRRVYRYRGRSEKVEDRFGTDFRPPLEPAFLRNLRPELVIDFTEGYGPEAVAELPEIEREEWKKRNRPRLGLRRSRP